MNLPPYPAFPVLSAENLVLREIQDADIQHILEISFYDGKQAETVEEAAEMQEKINRNYRDGESIHWGIADKNSNRIVGTCGYYRGLANGAGELGCILLPAYRGKGYMSLALQLAIRFGREVVGLQRIFAITSRENERAILLLERLGFVKTTTQEAEELTFDYLP